MERNIPSAAHAVMQPAGSSPRDFVAQMNAAQSLYCLSTNVAARPVRGPARRAKVLKLRAVTAAVGSLFLVFGVPHLAVGAPVNLAVNTSLVGNPSPLSSDLGWGGGSNKWEIVDGVRSYSSWAHGLAFTGGASGWGGQPGGLRQATIDFGAPTLFNEVVLWWHGVRDTPQITSLEYFDAATSLWDPIAHLTRTYGALHEAGSNSGYSDSDQYLFDAVSGSSVRVTFDNLGNAIDGGPMVHGWLYEFEVFNNEKAIPEPGNLVLALSTLGLVGLTRRLRVTKLDSA
jgi:hypothetical protein